VVSRSSAGAAASSSGFAVRQGRGEVVHGAVPEDANCEAHGRAPGTASFEDIAWHRYEAHGRALGIIAVTDIVFWKMEKEKRARKPRI